MKILITNDDSHRSPLLEMAVRYFSKKGEVTLVVPAYEQSWMGKSMTRFRAVHSTTTTLYGHTAFSVDGTPADCVNAGIHNLLPAKPDLIVSGINAGFNMGLGFLLSSGTVGACIEGNLAGIPGVAISQAFDTATRNQYVADYMIAPDLVTRFEEQTVQVLDRFFAKISGGANSRDLLKHSITWNINLPFRLTDPEILKVAPLGRSRYGRYFSEQTPINQETRILQHREIIEVLDLDPTCDSSCLLQGCATVSPIDVWRLTGMGESKAIVDMCVRF